MKSQKLGTLLRCSLAFFLSASPAFAQNNIPNAPRPGNFLDPDQENFGNWTPTQYINNGWYGYHVISKLKTQNNWIHYHPDKDTDEYYGPYCTDGVCDKEADTVIYRIGRTDVQGHRVEANEILGKAKVLRTVNTRFLELLTPQNINIARIDRQAALSQARFDESDAATFTGFNSAGAPIELGHLEGEHADKILHQVDSYYKREQGSDKFMVSTIHDIVLGRSDTHSDPGYRKGIKWCASDAFRVHADLVKYLKNDYLDTSACDSGPERMNSRTTGPLKELFFNRSPSDIFLSLPGLGLPGVTYNTKSNISKWAYVSSEISNGTSYGMYFKDTPVFYFDSETYTSMQNVPAQDGGKPNIPKIKILSVNWNRDPHFRPVTDYTRFTDPNPVIAGALVYEKLNELPGDLNGVYCEKDKWDSYTNKDYEKLSSKNAYLACHKKKTYTLHYYVLFPPTFNNKNVSNVQALSFIDRLLATMPDQVEQSPELNSGEGFIDEIRSLERFAHTGDPSSIDFNMLADLSSSEDAITAPYKSWDFLSDLGLVTPRRGRVDEDEAAIVKFANKRTNPTGVNKGETDSY